VVWCGFVHLVVGGAMPYPRGFLNHSADPGLEPLRLRARHPQFTSYSLACELCHIHLTLLCRFQHLCSGQTFLVVTPRSVEVTDALEHQVRLVGRVLQLLGLTDAAEH
jgi:hypothetical protein